MPKVDLSVLIPSRNEMFLAKTIENILSNLEGNTEIIAVCDGSWPDPPIQDDPRVTLVYVPKPIGQRAATNEAAKLSRATFVMKCDAHCSFDKGFDVKLMADIQHDWTIVPRMYNLHGFDWVCNKCGDRRYQGPTPTSCPKCDNKSDFRRDVLWKEKRNPTNDAMRFDSDLHFQYWGDYKKRPEAQPDIAPLMSFIGACWFMYRDRYWELDGLDEEHGSWGQVGTEVACKTWLSGGQLLVNKKTWFAHMFRTQGGDFSFPYPNPGIKKARARSRHLWVDGSWPKAKYPLSWLLEKFWPVPGWTEEQLNQLKINKSVPTTVSEKQAEPMEEGIEEKKQVAVPKKGMVYYTDNRLEPRIMKVVQDTLEENRNGHTLISVSLSPIKFGFNIVLPLTRGHLAMAKQQLAGIEACDANIIFMVEHDVIYPACHFDFIPPRKDTFYYNLNWWKVRTSDGQALHFKAKQVSGLCAYKDILVEYYRNRVKMIESGEIGGRRHFEPGSHYRDAYNKLTSHGFDTWMSEIPYVDIRHDTVVTRNIFDPSGYKNQVVDWTMADEIPHWGKTKGRFWEFLDDISKRAQ